MAEQTLDLRQKTNDTKNESSPDNQENGSRLSKGQIFLSWEAPEYVVYKKSAAWYIAFGVVLALLLFTAFLLQSFLTSIVFLLAGILIFFHAEKPPRIISYDIRSSGVKIDNKVYLFRELAAFNIVEHGDGIYILLKSKRLVMPLIHVPLGKTSHEEAEEIISKYIPLDPDFLEPFADILAHWVGF